MTGTIGIDDLSCMVKIWLTGDSYADITEPADGIVDFRDFSVFSQEWNQ